MIKKTNRKESRSTNALGCSCSVVTGHCAMHLCWYEVPPEVRPTGGTAFGIAHVVTHGGDIYGEGFHTAVQSRDEQREAGALAGTRDPHPVR